MRPNVTKTIQDKIRAAMAAAKAAGVPFDIAKVPLSDDERSLVGLPRLKATPAQVGGVAAGLAGDYPTAQPQDLSDFAGALMGTLPPVPFYTSGQSGPMDVAAMGPK